ncbi:hypothetical protein DY000_02000262 [Brassica cretica]|uniref:Uncharacterized protein n=1 Tax=Brassica cretica TaxID=69181 RepID=A0ABQ7CHI0_BRACR|nr:hypothetical protein DY000_02000262 [Brassica cretica]
MIRTYLNGGNQKVTSHLSLSPPSNPRKEEAWACLAAAPAVGASHRHRKRSRVVSLFVVAFFFPASRHYFGCGVRSESMEGPRVKGLFELYCSFEKIRREIEVYRSDCSFVGRLPPRFASLWGVGRMRRVESTIKIQWRVLVGIEGYISMIFSPGVIYECMLVRGVVLPRRLMTPERLCSFDGFV